MSEPTPLRERDGRELREKDVVAAGTSSSGRNSDQTAAGRSRGWNDADAASSRRIIGGAQVPPGPKRATRASTGARIALTAKGSLYKANKDTGTSSEEEDAERSSSQAARGPSAASMTRSGPISRSAANTGTGGGRRLPVVGGGNGGGSTRGTGNGGRGGGAAGNGNGGSSNVRGARGSQQATGALGTSMGTGAPASAATEGRGTGGAGAGTGAAAGTARGGRSPAAEALSEEGPAAARAMPAMREVLEAPTAPRRRRGRKGRSIYRGVCVTREGKWRAVIYKERKQLYLGVYESELEAAKAHDRAARFHFPDKSMTNFATEAEADLLINNQEERRRMRLEVDNDVATPRSRNGGSTEGGRGGGRIRRGDGARRHFVHTAPQWRPAEYDAPPPRLTGPGRRDPAGGEVPRPRGPSGYENRGAARLNGVQDDYGTSWHVNANGESDEYDPDDEGRYVDPRHRGVQDREVLRWGREVPPGDRRRGYPGTESGNEDDDWAGDYGERYNRWRGGEGRGRGGGGRELAWAGDSGPAVRDGGHSPGQTREYAEDWDAARGDRGGRRGEYGDFYKRYPAYVRDAESVWPRYGEDGSWRERRRQNHMEQEGNGQWQSGGAGGRGNGPGDRSSWVEPGHGYAARFGGRGGREWDEAGDNGDDMGECHDVRPTYAQHSRSGEGGSSGGVGRDGGQSKEEEPSDEVAAAAASFAFAQQLGLRDRDGHHADHAKRGRAGLRWGDESSNYDRSGSDGGAVMAGGGSEEPSPKRQHVTRNEPAPSWATRDWSGLRAAAEAADAAAVATAAAATRYSPGGYEHFSDRRRVPPIPSARPDARSSQHFREKGRGAADPSLKDGSRRWNRGGEGRTGREDETAGTSNGAESRRVGGSRRDWQDKDGFRPSENEVEPHSSPPAHSAGGSRRGGGRMEEILSPPSSGDGAVPRGDANGKSSMMVTEKSAAGGGSKYISAEGDDEAAPGDVDRERANAMRSAPTANGGRTGRDPSNRGVDDGHREAAAAIASLSRVPVPDAAGLTKGMREA